jgi:transcriptional regulator with XRE-family HTH domain
LKDKKMPTFAEKLIAWRDKKGLSNEQVAAELGANVRTVQNWLQGRNTPPKMVRNIILGIIAPPRVRKVKSPGSDEDQSQGQHAEPPQNEQREPPTVLGRQ